MEKYQELARRGNTSPSRFIAGSSVILFLYLIIGGIYTGIYVIARMFFKIANDPLVFIDDKILKSSTELLKMVMSPMEQYIVANLAIYFLALGAFIAVRYIHYRPFLSLITSKPRLEWKKFWIGFAVFGLLLIMGTVVDYFISPETYSVSFDASKFWIALPLILIMTPLQTTAEELVFRGYVIQAFGLKIKSGLILSLISGFIFTLPHLANPEVYASNEQGVLSTICMILNYFLIGALLALVTIRTNSLEVAMGVHAVNNLICFLLVSFPDTALPTNTVFFTTKFNPASSLISTAIISAIFYFIIILFVKEKSDIEQNVTESV